MKKLFFLLVVVNLVIWLWGQREELGRMAGTAQPDFGAIRVIDEADLAARREQAAAGAQLSPPVESAPAVVEQRVETARAEPVRTAAAAQQLAEAPPDAAPDVVEATPEPPVADTPPASATAPAGVVPEPVEPAEPQEPAVLPTAPTGTEVTTVAPDTAPVASGPAEPVVGVPSAADPIEAWPAKVTESATEPIAASSQPPVADDAALTTRPPAAEAESASAPATPGTAAASADTAASSADSTPSVPSVEVAEPMPETAPITTDAGALESAALPEERAPVDAAQSEQLPSEMAHEPPAETETTAPAEAVAPGEPAVGSEPGSESREVLYLCESLGPFRERTAAERIVESLQAPLRAVALREERVARTTRYWVLAPVQPDRQALADYIGRLEQAGVRDAWRIPSGPFAGRLAVGVFQAAGNARKHADMLESRGVAAEVHAPKDEERRYWIDYERPADADAPEPAARSGSPPQIVPRDCGRVAGP